MYINWMNEHLADWPAHPNQMFMNSVYTFCHIFLLLPVLHELVEVLLHVLKDKVEVVVLPDHLL